MLTGYHPAEAMALVTELPPEARFFARMQGEKTGMAYRPADWLLLDMRDIAESVRVMTALKGDKHASKEKAKREFRPWKNYPGAKAQARRKAQRAVDSLKRFATGHTQR